MSRSYWTSTEDQTLGSTKRWAENTLIYRSLARTQTLKAFETTSSANSRRKAPSESALKSLKPLDLPIFEFYNVGAQDSFRIFAARVDALCLTNFH
jgi:hypothetical protein